MTFEHTLQVLREEEAVRRKNERWLKVTVGSVVGFTFIAVLFLVLNGRFDVTDILSSLATFFVLIGAGAGLTPKAKSALLGAVESRDPRLVAHLFEAIDSGEEQLRVIAMRALAETLPSVDDASPRLDSVQHRGLVSAWTRGDEAFRLALLPKLPILGRPESVLFLERTLEDKSISTKLRGALLHALPNLRMALAREIVTKAVIEADARRDADQERLARVSAG